jgi:SAM-dependent methyltransferase
MEEPWYEHAFGQAYLRLYAKRNDAEAILHAPRICEWLGIRAGQRLLDVACGAGRYARALGRLGLRVTGVDLSGDLLRVARETSPPLPGAPLYVQWDVRHLPYAQQFEGAISMFTSIGYFGSRDDDLAILKGVFRALVPGGRFVLDYLNERQVRAELEPLTDEVRDDLHVRVERRIVEDAPGGPSVLKSVQMDSVRTRLIEAAYVERVRLYTAAELDSLLEDAGFALAGERMGDYDGSPAGDAAPRSIRIAQRPARRR